MYQFTSVVVEILINGFKAHDTKSGITSELKKNFYLISEMKRIKQGNRESDEFVLI